MRARPLAVLACAAVLALVAVPVASAAWWNGMPEAKTHSGKTVEDIYGKIFIAGLFFFVLVFVLLVWVLARYREGSGHGQATHEKHRGSTIGEVIWVVGPLLVVLWVGWISFQGLQELDGAVPESEIGMELKVTGSQWNWNADYGHGVSLFSDPAGGVVKESNYFWVPADTNIRFTMTSKDVIHAFDLMDDNHMTVHLVDANPGGPHAHNSFVVSLPVGEYPVQCKEMCLNPGHAYMRAHVKAVPMAQFQAWYNEKELAVGAQFVMPATFTLSDSGFATTGSTTLASGGRVVAHVTSTATEPMTIQVNGKDALTVQPGATQLFAFDTTSPGALHVSASNGQEVVFNVISAEAKQVALGAYHLDPEHLDLQVGKTYLIQVTDTHSTAHNLYIGHYADGAEKVTLAASPTVDPGQGASFLYTPTEAGSFDMWCDVPGHYGNGMHGTVTISA